MNNKLIVGLSSLLKIDKDVIVEALTKEDGDDVIIKDFREKHNVFTLEDVSKIKANAINEAKPIILKELAEADTLPKEIYERAKGLALDKMEKEIAKQYGVSEWTSLNDLVGKINTQGKGGDDNLKAQIELLKTSLKEAEVAKQTALKEVEDKYVADFVNRDFEAATAAIVLDGDEATVSNQKKLFNSAFQNQFTKSYKDGKTVVLDTSGKVVVDKIGDPMPVGEVYKSFILSHGAKLKEVDAGGRGDGSSRTDTNTLKGKTFAEVAALKGVKQNTDEADKLYVEWKSENPN
jgi:hypothetical protein